MQKVKTKSKKQRLRTIVIVRRTMTFGNCGFATMRVNILRRKIQHHKFLHQKNRIFPKFFTFKITQTKTIFYDFVRYKKK